MEPYVLGASKRGHSALSLGLHYFTKMLWLVLLCSMLLESRLGEALHTDSPGSKSGLCGLWASHFTSLSRPHTVPPSLAGQGTSETKTCLMDTLLIHWPQDQEEKLLVSGLGTASVIPVYRFRIFLKKILFVHSSWLKNRQKVNSEVKM